MKNNHIKDIHLEGVKVSTIFCGIKKTPHNEDDLLLVEFDESSSIAGVVYFDSGHTNGPHVRFRKGGTDQFYIGGSGGIGGGSGYYDHYAISGLGIRFFTAATQALVLDTSQNATFAGNVEIISEEL